jgi:hypothetical protein
MLLRNSKFKLRENILLFKIKLFKINKEILLKFKLKLLLNSNCLMEKYKGQKRKLFSKVEKHMLLNLAKLNKIKLLLRN